MQTRNLDMSINAETLAEFEMKLLDERDVLRSMDFEIHEREANVGVKESDLKTWEQKLHNLEGVLLEKQKNLRAKVAEVMTISPIY